ncbi:helix-turn-helix transcriptional regulator [Chryseobacterium sp. 09-1422]|uniref:Helix-turn-helix transcriptional regulator n=1 Tax=Chryseobacterium kimseyorum TaxID=2984028 RepID=A0ABT3HV00_9FLAO|nr:helix-turn-helix domain-containing protein [Chryseobacterium kimseyorum]MCW3167606.1 helix-turn-helix transcriptional regulator [Chryseobacterium kimseyorum]
MKEIGKRSTCAISYSLDLFGDKWTLLILRDMIFSKKNSWLEWKNAYEGIAPSVLTDRVNLLTNEGVIMKKVSEKNASKFLYYLTNKGLDLIPLMVDLMEFGSTYHLEGGSKYWLEKIKKNINKTIEDLRAEMITARNEAFPEMM